MSTSFLTLESQTPALQWLTMEPSSPQAQIALTSHTVTPVIPTPVSTQPVVRWAEPVWLLPSGGADALSGGASRRLRAGPHLDSRAVLEPLFWGSWARVRLGLPRLRQRLPDLLHHGPPKTGRLLPR